MPQETGAPSGRWSSAERARLGVIVAVIAGLHVLGWSLYLWGASHRTAAATSLAGTGALAYALGVRHAFDADHIAAIDDATRLMLARGRRPLGVGFFFAMGHSSVVLALSVLVVAAAASGPTAAGMATLRAYGGVAAALAGMVFLLLVAALNAGVLAGMVRLWRQLGRGELDEAELERQLLNRGLVNRVLGGRARALVRSSAHMFVVGLLFGLGLETASEITLLTLSASAAGGLPPLAALTPPVLFAAGMSTFDTGDGLLMTRAYSWASASPARRLYYNAATTGLTVLVAAFVATVYLAGLLASQARLGGLVAGYAALGGHFETLGYVIVAVFAAGWAGAALTWRVGGFERRYRRERA